MAGPRTRAHPAAAARGGSLGPGHGAAPNRNGRAPLRHPEPWYLRKRIVWPLAFFLPAGMIVAALWWNIPVTNPLTGVRENYGAQVQRLGHTLFTPTRSLTVAFSAHNQITVLLVGLDHVPEKHGEEPVHRSDSLILATTDFTTKQVRLLSIPRDGWAMHYQGGTEQGYDKLAHTYALGGIERTSETIGHLMGVTPDFYIIVKFEGLARLIDALGGLTVDVEKDMNYDDRRGNLHIHLKQGEQHLTGEEVVAYARFRHDAWGDIARMERQQKVMRLLLTELTSARNIPRLPTLANAIRECVETNLSADQLLALAQHADEYSPAGIQTQTLMSYNNQEPGHRIDLPGAPHGMSAQAILEGDVEHSREFLLDLAPPPPPPPPEQAGAANQATPAEGAGETGAAGGEGGG